MVLLYHNRVARNERRVKLLERLRSAVLAEGRRCCDLALNTMEFRALGFKELRPIGFRIMGLRASVYMALYIYMYSIGRCIYIYTYICM